MPRREKGKWEHRWCSFWDRRRNKSSRSRSPPPSSDDAETSRHANAMARCKQMMRQDENRHANVSTHPPRRGQQALLGSSPTINSQTNITPQISTFDPDEITTLQGEPSTRGRFSSSSIQSRSATDAEVPLASLFIAQSTLETDSEHTGSRQPSTLAHIDITTSRSSASTPPPRSSSEAANHNSKDHEPIALLAATTLHGTRMNTPSLSNNMSGL